MKKIAVILAICILNLSLYGCAPESNMAAINRKIQLEEMDTRKNDFDKRITESINDMGIDLLKKASKGKENAIVSPLSLSVVLALLSSGAEGETQKEIEEVINSYGLKTEELNEQYGLLLNILNNLGYKEENKKTTIVNTVNSIWTANNLPLKEEFAVKANKYYDTEIYDVDFKDKKTIEEINGWISDKTNGKINNYLSEISPETFMYIFNSLYFKGKWRDEFNESNTRDEEFYLKDGSTVTVDMMNAERQITCFDDDEVTAGKLNYYGCSMQIIIPKGDIDDYIGSLDYSKIQSLEERSEYLKAKIKLPKFTYESEYSFTETLKELGINEAFNPDEADFEGITDQDTLYVDDISQKCFISLDEKGTEAAALTSVAICGSAKPPEKIVELYADRPFIYVIKDSRTGSIMFAGVVYKP